MKRKAIGLIASLVILAPLISLSYGVYITAHIPIPDHLYFSYDYDHDHLTGNEPFLKNDRKLSRILDETASIAKKKGFVFKKPRVKVSHVKPSPTTVFAVTIGEKFIIFFSSETSYFKEDGLKVLMAHELGHVIDHQSHRKHQPLSDEISSLDNEDYANVIACRIYSKELVIAQKERYAIAWDTFLLKHLNID